MNGAHAFIDLNLLNQKLDFVWFVVLLPFLDLALVQ